MKENINLNLYKIFYEVAKNGSINITAQKSYISQPAISKSIKSLEQAYQQKLFHRTSKGMVLTESGEQLYKCVDEALSMLNYAEEQLFAKNNIKKGTLKIGAPSHIISLILMEEIYEFHKKYPNIEMTIICRSTEELIKMLRNDNIDIIIDIISYKDEISGLSIKKLKDMVHCFVVKTDSNFINYKTKHSLKELENLPLILPAKHSSHRRKIEEIAKMHQTKYNNVFSIETSEIICEAVKNNCGIGYILEDVVKKDLQEGTMKKIQLKEKLPKASLYLIYKEKNLSSYSLTFITDYLKEI